MSLFVLFGRKKLIIFLILMTHEHCFEGLELCKQIKDPCWLSTRTCLTISIFLTTNRRYVAIEEKLMRTKRIELFHLDRKRDDVYGRKE